MIIDAAPAPDPVVIEDSKSAISQGKLDANFNQFLVLLVTQLQNQDPLDPLDANEFTSQLVQFASVEQQIQQNANLEKLVALQESALGATMVDFLGTVVEAAGKEAPLIDGELKTSYTLDTVAGGVTITVRNAGGISVFTTTGETEFGKHTFVWDGKNNDGIDQPEGPYTIEVSAKDKTGGLLDVERTIFGRVTGAGVVDGSVSLFMNEVTVPIFDIITVNEPPEKKTTETGP